MAGQRFKNILLTAALVAGIASCGGGLQLAGGGIGGTGVSQGPITQFGSIWVNGVEFNTSGATLDKDGTTVHLTPTDDSNNYLKRGMVVTVNGDIAGPTSGIAAAVTYNKDLQGPISSVNPPTLTVLGQTVIVDNLTQIDIPNDAAPTIDHLNQNDMIEVSGLPSASGAIRATYIGVKPPSADVEIKGTIDAVGNGTITINALTVNYLRAINPGFTPQKGDYVEVKGTLSGSTLVANSLELKSHTLSTDSKSQAEMQGYVTGVVSITDFVLNAQPVHTDALTKFSGGAATDVKLGMKLEVQGALVNGTLNAATVNFEDDSALDGNIATIDATKGLLTLDTYPGVDISFNAVLTETEGGADLIHLNLVAGNHVKIRGRKLEQACPGGGTLVCMLATQIELESSGSGTPGSASNPVLLQGNVDAITFPYITILGVQVDTSQISSSSFSGDGVTDQASFFANLQAPDPLAGKTGSLVEVHGTRDTMGNVVWNSIQLDD